ncbi:hypothetical protein [Nocardioides sp. InS609-2]|uniref:hypothetical protein n=1 Tax=Nocardioides sp. InS609-2 TaxID=2760705 RepID=UPI0020BF89A0|nr:hypothetical protein [Nocardioides sp. InS609-2]
MRSLFSPSPSQVVIHLGVVPIRAYASGRMWIENIRIDPVRFDDIFGLRLIVWVSMAAIAIAGVCLWRLRRKYGAEDDALYRHAAS